MRVIDIDREKLLPHSMAFNPSICRYGDKVLMAYRREDRNAASWAQLALVELDDDLQPIPETNRHLDIPEPHPGTDLREDPRLYVFDGQLVMSFIAATVTDKGHVACQGLAYFDDSLTIERIVYPRYGYNQNAAFCGSPIYKGEKNWTFYQQDGELRAIYKLNPCEIVAIGKDGTCERRSYIKPALSWKWGFMAGSTPLASFEDSHLGVFHSFERINGIRTYCVGLYIFDPRQGIVTAVSKAPFLRAEMDKQKDLRPLSQKWRPNVIFPCGLMERGDDVFMSYGWQDCRCRLGILNRQEILDSLITVPRQLTEKVVLQDPCQPVPGGYMIELQGQRIRGRNYRDFLTDGKNRGFSEDVLVSTLCARLPKSFTKLIWL